MDEYWPKDRDLHRLPRQFVISLTYSILGEELAAWAKERVEARNAKLAEKQNLMVSMDSKIADAFLASTFVSRKYFLLLSTLHVLIRDPIVSTDSRGTAAYLCKPTSKRRSTKAERLAREVEEEVKSVENSQAESRIRELEQ